MTVAFDVSELADVLWGWIRPRVPEAAWTWLQDRRVAVASGDRKSLYLAFGLTPRKTGKGDLVLTESELEQALSARPGWHPTGWTIDQAARMALLLSLPEMEPAEYVRTLDQLFSTGEVHELLALYQGLGLYPHQADFQLRCAEGIRSNIRGVFLAIAHGNPYPAEQLGEDPWNQLILKCLFVGTTLDPVVGIDPRSNPALARMLTDFAHERWAAKRPVSPELWRCVGPHADDGMLADLQKVLTTGSEVERHAAALALASCPRPEAAQILKEAPELEEGVRDGTITWTKVAAQIA